MANFTIGGVLKVAAIGALISSTFNLGINFALGLPLGTNAGWAALFGFFAAPLALLFPVLAVGLAIFGVFMASLVNYHVFLNKDSTLAQKSVAVLLLIASVAFGFLAAKSFRAADNKWINTQAFRGKTNASQPLRNGSTLEELFPGIGDDAYIHFTPQGPKVMQSGVNPKSFWWRFGDIKHLTLTQVQSLIGPLAAGGETSSSTYAISTNAGAFQARPSANPAGIVEYVNTSTVAPDAVGIVSAPQ